MLFTTAGRSVKMKATRLAICAMIQVLFLFSDVQLTCRTGRFGFLTPASPFAMLVPESLSLHAVACCAEHIDRFAFVNQVCRSTCASRSSNVACCHVQGIHADIDFFQSDLQDCFVSGRQWFALGLRPQWLPETACIP
jgi:hypothetical protein